MKTILTLTLLTLIHNFSMADDAAAISAVAKEYDINEIVVKLAIGGFSPKDLIKDEYDAERILSNTSNGDTANTYAKQWLSNHYIAKAEKLKTFHEIRTFCISTLGGSGQKFPDAYRIAAKKWRTFSLASFKNEELDIYDLWEAYVLAEPESHVAGLLLERFKKEVRDHLSKAETKEELEKVISWTTSVGDDDKTFYVVNMKMALQKAVELHKK